MSWILLIPSYKYLHSMNERLSNWNVNSCSNGQASFSPSSLFFFTTPGRETATPRCSLDAIKLKILQEDVEVAFDHHWRCVNVILW